MGRKQRGCVVRSGTRRQEGACGQIGSGEARRGHGLDQGGQRDLGGSFSLKGMMGNNKVE